MSIFFCNLIIITMNAFMRRKANVGRLPICSLPMGHRYNPSAATFQALSYRSNSVRNRLRTVQRDVRPSGV